LSSEPIQLLRDGADTLEKNPYALEYVMNTIDHFWGIETGRIEKEKDEEN